MKVEMIVGMAGPGVRYTPGDIVELTAKEAQRLIDAGIAEAVEEAEPEPKPKRTRRKKAEG